MGSSAFCVAVELVKQAGWGGESEGGPGAHTGSVFPASRAICSLSFRHFHTSKDMIPQDVRERQERHECLYAYDFTVKLLFSIESTEIV